MLKDKIKHIVRKINLKIIMFFVLVIYVMVVILSYRTQLMKIKDRYVNTYINDMMEETNYKLQLKIQEKFSFLENIAYCMKMSGMNDDKTVNGLVEVLRNNEDSRFAYLIYKDGRIVGDKEEARGYRGESYYESAMAGERKISTVYESKEGDYLIFAVPVYSGKDVAATLQCAYDISVFADLVENSAFNKKVSTFVAQSDGVLITRPDSIGETTNLFKLLNKLTSSSERTIKKLQTKLENGDSGIMLYNSGKYKRYICYYYMAECDWYSVSIVSEKSVDPQKNKIIRQNTMLSTQIITGFVLYIVFIVVYDKYIKKYIQSKMKL